MKPHPKPVKSDKHEMTSSEFRKKYSGKKKGTGVKELVKELDSWFSRRVRLEECDSNYKARCVDCGAPVDVRKADCGHYHSRKYYATRWVRENCAVQMKWHNNMMGDPTVNEGFRNELIRRHGKINFEMLAVQKNNYFKLDAGMLSVMIEENRNIVNKLLAEKGLKRWW